MQIRGENSLDQYNIDRTDQLETISTGIAETYGLDIGIARVGTEWARDWWYYLQDTNEPEMTRDLLLQSREIALDGLPVPRDHTEHRPTFRVRYAAQEALARMAGEPQGSTIRQLLEEERPQADGHKHRVIPDFKRIDDILNTLLDSYARKLWPFNLDSTRVPQDPRHMPRRPEFTRSSEERSDEDNRKLALFWFHDCYYMRGVNDSNDMTINLSQLYEDHSELFEPSYSQTLDPKHIERLLLEYHLPVQHKQISEFWVENARRLVADYNGDPRQIFDDFGTYEELVRRVRNDHKGGGFLGFQKKMTSMLGYFMMTNDLVPYQNIPLPVDFHVMRMSIETEMIRFPSIRGEAIKFDLSTDFLREIFYDFADRHDISQLDLCDVVWLYSREACVQSPTNAQKILGRRAGRATVWVPAISSPSEASHQQIEAYQAACGSLCRFHDLCTQNVPSGEYYVSGRILYPNPKIHFETTSQGDLHEQDALFAAQQGKRSEKAHAIDKRNAYRQAEQSKRHAQIRKLAHPALIDLTLEQTSSVAAGIIKTDRMPTASLSGKLFAYTESEIVAALGDIPDEDTLLNLKPYLNREIPKSPEKSSPL